jgi:hypothetical protein
VRPDQLEKARRDRRPDAPTRRTCRRVAATIGATVEVAHVIDRYLDAQLHWFADARVDDGHLASTASQVPRDLAERTLRRRQADPLRVRLGERAETLETHGEVRSALGAGQNVNLVDDDCADAAQRFARCAREHEEQRFRCGDEDVGRVAHQVAPLRR